MDPTHANPQPSPTSSRLSAPIHRFSQIALGLSIFAFIPPLGIAAVVLGHIAEQRIDSSAGLLNGKTTARAALWIAYLQIALVTLTLLFMWSLFHETARGFQRDALVQRVLRASDQMQPLDPQSAQEAEGTAQTLVYQVIAIEEQVQRHRENGSYACQLSQLIDAGLEGSTDAEKRAVAVRVLESPYMFQISNCNPMTGGMESAAYILAAVPRPPRMPQGSAIFCANQTGVVRRARGRTSLDCIESGQPMP
jgi:hypothetical protein